MREEKIKEYLMEARSKGWWLAAFYWDKKLTKKQKLIKIKK